MEANRISLLFRQASSIFLVRFSIILPLSDSSAKKADYRFFMLKLMIPVMKGEIYYDDENREDDN